MKIRHLLISTSLLLGTTIGSTQTAYAGSDAFISEVFTMGSNFCPRGSAPLEGQLLAVSSNTALFSLLGTTYGGDGRTTFGLPDARGRAIIGPGTGPGLSNQRLGSRGGAEQVVLTEAQLPSHSHRAGIKAAAGAATSTNPSGRAIGTTASNTFADVAGGSVPGNRFLHEGTVVISPAGDSQSIPTRSPFVVVTQCITLQGIFPSRN